MANRETTTDQVEREIGVVLRDCRLKVHQRRAVAVVMLMASCSRDQAVASLERWSQHKAGWAQCWEKGEFMNGACGGYIEAQAAFSVLADAEERRKSARRLTLIEGGAAAAKGLLLSELAEARRRRFYVGVRITRGLPVVNDGPLTEQPHWHTQVQGAAVKRAKERRNG